ncbi:amphi-Trp domain-containing protein [Streptomyces neyagawaensis]|uniref:amphi-Trp domain-containing protein n=1 Tax=Streptomyces neyagawaensis TaxID=42238 RepID=UPI0006E402A8|nr:amphi-Trp domain-containing protein [Streptomyces neyagawaensis]MCL6731702.1 amphi-Trp domain-containing protein [Streptomyces neyagawaensis]MDE1683258.1 amphi-Trp domain-containing protein [Streptomyces neyagawaensis]
MKDLKFEQKRSLSRREAADQLTALAEALREGGEADIELTPGTLSLRIPDDLRSEIEVEIGDGEVELEIEFKWRTAGSRTASSEAAKPTPDRPTPDKPTPRKTTPATSARSGPSRPRTTKRAPAKTP